MSEIWALHSSRVLVCGAFAERWLVIEDDRITNVCLEEPDGVVTIELGDDIVSPGFVDTHIHGYAGVDALTCADEDLMRMGEALAREGTTSWLATFPAAAPETIDAACEKVARAVAGGCAGLRGIFLEGPFLSPNRAGAQKRDVLRSPSLGLLDRWQQLADGLIRKVAVAPELEGAADFIRGCADRGIVAAIGHTDASFDEARAAVDAGATVFVHTYNAMSALHHREPGTVGAALTADGTYCELIADGHHVSRAAAEVLVRSRGWGSVALITDCLSAAGTAGGTGTLGETPVEAHGNVCHLAGTSTLAGTALTMRGIVANIVTWGLVSREQSLCMASEIPARSLGLFRECGSITPGASADLVILDDVFACKAVYMGGRRLV